MNSNKIKNLLIKLGEAREKYTIEKGKLNQSNIHIYPTELYKASDKLNNLVGEVMDLATKLYQTK